MMEECIPSILAYVYGWLTPAVLFVLLNLVIGTIAVASKSSSSSSAQQPKPGPATDVDDAAESFPARFLSRSPSIILDRLRSVNLQRDRSGKIPPPLEAAPAETPIPAAKAEEQHKHFSRSQSDAHPTAGEMPPKLAVRLKKSASEKSAFAHFEEAEVEEAVAVAAAAEETEKVEAADPAAEEGDRGGDEVDARADDFINRFRRHLQLQRMESITRYEETLNRPS